MRKLLALSVSVALLVPLAGVATGEQHPGARVIVSTTLNSTLQFFDASSFEQLQPPLPSRGGGPVRLWVQTFDDHTYLFAANHGVALGSVGTFDLDGDLVTELPLSPFPARVGSVGIVAGSVNQVPVVLVTNTYQALGGCDLPQGSVTAYDASALSSSGLLTEIGTLEVSGAQPWAVSLDEVSGRAYVSVNCSNELVGIDIHAGQACIPEIDCSTRIEHAGSSPTGARPDGTVFDAARGLNYTVNIGGHSVSVHDGSGLRTTVPLPGAGPIEATLASSPGGRDWLITANGSDDSISIVDLDVLAGCVAANADICEAEVARIATAVPGGAPEGVAYDPGTNRVFVVNKTFPPSLSVIQLTDAPGGITGEDIHRIPLNALGPDVPVPAPIAFDVVVHTP